MLMRLNPYAWMFMISIVMLILLLVVSQSQNITLYLLMFGLIVVANMGYFTVSTSKTLENALTGHRLVYLGGVFIPILLLFSTMRLCQIQIPSWLVTILLITSGIVLVGTFSVGYSDMYYSSVSLANEEGIAYLIKEYGPLHKSYMVLLAGCILGIVGIVMYSFITNKNVPYRVTFYMLLIAVITTSCYMARRISGGAIEPVIYAYILDESLIILLINRIGKYEIMESVANSLDENSTNGYIAFDENRRFVSCNEMAKQFLPELEKQRVDEYLDEKCVPVLYEAFGARLKKATVEETQCLIESGDLSLACSLKVLHPGKSERIDGYLIEMVDDTTRQKYMKLLNSYNDDLEREVKLKTEHVSRLQDRMVLALADMIENRDTSTGGHIKRTSEVIRIFTSELVKCEEEYGFNKSFLEYVVKAAPMHDLGKIAVDDRILRKPGSITEEEFKEMKMHSEKGAEIVMQILAGVEDEEFVRIARNVAHYHHEKWNGEGYPTGLSGISIPPEARIMALADVFDALICKRCYKGKMDYDEAFGIIENSLGSHFDPELGKMFLKCRTKLEAFYNGVQ